MISIKTLMMAHVLLLFFANGVGAVPVEEWNRTFGGAYRDGFYSVVQTPDEGYIISGYTIFNESNGNLYTWLIKTDREGQLQWNRTYPAQWIGNVSTTLDGGYILRGMSNDNDFWLMKTDADGQEQWNRTLNIINITFLMDIEETSDGGSIVAGVEEILPQPEDPPWWDSRLIKVDARGNEQWNITLKKLQEFEVMSVQQTSDGGYILAGSIFSLASYILPGIPIMDYGDSYIQIIKTDANGSQQWEKTFGWWGEREGAKSAIQTRDGGYMIEGIKVGRFYDGPGYNELLIKIDANGNEKWNRDFGKSWGPFFSAIVQTSDGGYIFICSTKYETDEIQDWLIKTDANGSLQWKRVLEGTKMDKPKLRAGYSIKETSDHGYILAGSTESYGAGNNDAWLVRIRDSNSSSLETIEADIYGSGRKSTSGFEISGAIVSMVILFLLVRKRT
jgi:hypothetical protein